eukprot:4415081-Pleurochrysis_carterae.AAC.1
MSSCTIRRCSRKPEHRKDEDDRRTDRHDPVLLVHGVRERIELNPACDRIDARTRERAEGKADTVVASQFAKRYPEATAARHLVPLRCARPVQCGGPLFQHARGGPPTLQPQGDDRDVR